MNTRIARLMVVVCALSMLAACARPQPVASPMPEAPASATPLPAATRPTEPTATAPATAATNPIQFVAGDCPFQLSEGQTAGKDVLCGYVTVPEDHANPGGPVIQLAVVVFKSQNANPPADPVILLSGGPGEKTVHSAPGVAAQMKTLYGDRDFIVFDQRGVGLSKPSLECAEYTQAYIDMLAEPNADVGSKVMFEAAMQCRDRLVKEGYNLSAFNTTQNAADVEAIRVALGYDTLNLMGASYGSLLAQEVMRAFPTSIRSVAMNSVMPRNKSILVDSALATAEAGERLLDACATDTACNTAYPNLRDTLFKTVDKLNANPVYITVTSALDGKPYRAALTGDALFGNLTMYLYLTPLIPALPRVITDVSNGDYTLMAQLQGVTFLLVDAISRGMGYSVLCAEDLIGQNVEDYLNRLTALPPQLAGQTSPDELRQSGIFAVCSNWPVKQADASIKQPIASDIPALIVTGQFDPVTPPEFGRQVADGLANSYFFELPGVGHDVIVSSECARQIISRFFDAPDRAPEAACAAETKTLSFDLPVTDKTIMLKPAKVGDPAFAETLVPDGWNELSPGVFTRSKTGADQVALVVAFSAKTGLDAFLSGFATSLGLDAPDKAEERQAGDLTWSLYTMDVQGVSVALALVESGDGVLAVVLQSPADEFDGLYEQVFVPVLDATKPLQ